jgi:ribonuclease Y
MEDLILYVSAAALVALILGVIIGRFLLMKVFKQNEEDAKEKAKLILKEADIQAESLKKDRILEAKEKFLKKRQTKRKTSSFRMRTS